MPNEWIGVIQTTAPKYFKGATDNTIRKRLWMSMLRKRGRITQGHSGTEIKWQIQFDEPPVESRGDDQPVTYARRDVYRQLTLDWREYIATDRMTKREKEMNNGNEALIRRYDQIMPNLVKAIDNKLGLEMYVDGYASGNATRFCGFDSFTGTSTTTAADKIAYPSDTYAGRSTAPGSMGGTWSADLTVKPNAALATDWPSGAGDANYDWLTPKLLNWSANSWGTSSQTWLDNCERVLRQAQIWCSTTSGVEGAPELVVMDPALFVDFKNKQSSYKHIYTPSPEADDLGFANTLLFDGLTLYSEFGVPAGCAYGHNLMEEELMILGKDFYKPDGPTWDPDYNAWLFQVNVMGNMKFNPKAQFKLKNYAT